MDIAVAGGGIAGLAAAIALSRRGFHVAVHERATEPREIGAGIQLSPNAMTVLARLGLEAAVMDFATEPAAIEIRDSPSARLLTRLPLGPEARSRYGAPYCVIRRADLHAVLLREARRSTGVEVRFGAEVDYARSSDASVSFTIGGSPHQADLLVAADGVNSRLRTGSFRLPAARDLGKAAWRATLPAQVAAGMIPIDVTGLWFGRGAHMVHYPVARGAEINVVVIGDRSRGDEPPLAQFAEAGARMLRASALWSTWPLQVLDPAPWVSGRMVLIGDAAHAMPPSAAQGGAQAIEDAWFLAASLSENSSPIPDALAQFAATRRRRVERIGRESQRNLAIYNMSGIRALARNAAISAMPVPLHQARLDWLYRLPGGKDSA